MLKDDELNHLAHLARLVLKEEERQKLLEDLNRILNYISEINKVAEDDEPMINLFSQTKLREDKPLRTHYLHEINDPLKNNFPAKDEEGHLRVPKILDK